MTTMMMMMVTTVMMIMMTTTVQGVALKTEERGVRTKRSDDSGEEGEWSLWFNSDRPWNGEGDFETTDNIKKTYEICPSDYSVVSAECRVAGTNDSFDSSTTAFLDDRLLQACSRHGLICLNAQQGSRAGCHDYEVRFLCQATQSEHNSLFPNLDYRIYILLAAVPLVVILLRVMWTCCCKARVKRRHQQQRQGQRNSDTSSSGSLSTSSSQASFDSTLANPPPPYVELFGDSQPVFAISGGSGRGECAACGKCLHSPYFVSVPSVLPSSPPPTFPSQNVGGSEVVSSSGGNDDVFLPSNCTSQTVASSTSQTGMSNSAEPVLRASLPSNSSLQGAAALPVVSSTAFANPNSNDVHSCCACACHHTHVNLAFRWDSNDPATSVSGGPAVLPGMHKPVFNFPRIDSTTSFTSYASLPDYEEAVEILKKSGLVLEEDKL